MRLATTLTIRPERIAAGHSVDIVLSFNYDREVCGAIEATLGRACAPREIHRTPGKESPEKDNSHPPHKPRFSHGCRPWLEEVLSRAVPHVGSDNFQHWSKTPDELS